MASENTTGAVLIVLIPLWAITAYAVWTWSAEQRQRQAPEHGRVSNLPPGQHQVHVTKDMHYVCPIVTVGSFSVNVTGFREDMWVVFVERESISSGKMTMASYQKLWNGKNNAWPKVSSSWDCVGFQSANPNEQQSIEFVVQQR